MKGSRYIHHRPYIPPNRPFDKTRPYICRLAPLADAFDLEWLRREEGVHTLFISKRGENTYREIALNASAIRVDGLENSTEYEFYIESPTGIKSNTRLLLTGTCPEGTSVINYLHPDDAQYDFSGRYLCSPSLLRLPNGNLLAGMDLFGPEKGQCLSLLFTSSDNGNSWQYVTDLYPFYWANLFLHKGAVYALGQSQEYGDLMLIRSDDNGHTWSQPALLLYGSSVRCSAGGPQHTPMHIVNYNGRLYTSYEYGNWSIGGHQPGVISIDENADLMCAENWSFSETVPFEGRWAEESGTRGDAIEGNMVIAPDNNLYCFMRYKIGELLKMRVDTDNADAPMQYIGIYPAPVSNSMFRILAYKGKYLLITNRKTEESAKYNGKSYRNVLSLYVTEDLEHFKHIRDIVDFRFQNPQYFGFQYPCPILEKDGLRLSIRSAFNNANSYHNSNYMLYCFIPDEEIMQGF